MGDQPFGSLPVPLGMLLPLAENREVRYRRKLNDVLAQKIVFINIVAELDSEKELSLIATKRHMQRTLEKLQRRINDKAK